MPSVPNAPATSAALRMGQGRLHAMRLIFLRDCQTLLLSASTWIVAFLGGLVGFLFLNTDTQSVVDSGLAILSGAFNFPLYSILLINALYLALASVTSIARECEQGTLETLFYGPIDTVSYIGGKLTAFGVTYAAILAVCILGYLPYAALTGFTMPAPIWAIIGLSLPVTLHVVAVGTFLSTASRRVRTSLGWFLAIILGLLALQFSPDLIALAPATNRFYQPMRLMRQILEQIHLVVTWLSPFSLLIKGTEAVRRGDAGQYLEALGITIAFAALFTAGSMGMLHRLGVRS